MVIFSSHTLTDGLPGADSRDPEFIQINTARIAGSALKTLTWSIAFLQTGSESACILTQGAAGEQGPAMGRCVSVFGTAACTGLGLAESGAGENEGTNPIFC